MKTIIRSLSIVLILAGCDGEPNARRQCPNQFVNGQIVRDKLTGERFVVTNADEFINIYVGSCAVMLSNGYVSSTYALVPETTADNK